MSSGMSANLQIRPYRGTGTHIRHATCRDRRSGRAGGRRGCCPRTCGWICFLWSCRTDPPSCCWWKPEQAIADKFKPPHRGKYRFAFVVFLHRERERGKAHLSYTPLEHFADVCRLRQEFHVGDSSQVHGGVDVEALGFSWGRLPLHWALVHPQVAGPLVSLSHDSVPLAQSDGLWTAKDGLAWKPKKQTQRFNLYLFCSSLSVNLSLSYTRYYLKHIQ